MPTRIPENVPTRVPSADQGRTRITRASPMELRSRYPQSAVVPAGTTALPRMLPAMNDLDDAAYELFAVPAGAEEAALPRIGRYPSYDEALRARDKDVLDELAARGGWYAVIEHMIVGPGLAGPRTAHRHATALGVDPAAGRVPSPDDIDDARRWLTAVRES